MRRWEGGPGEYHVFRRAPGENSFAEVAKVSEPEWLDHDTKFGTEYTYLVQRVVPAGDRVAQSELSEPAVITPKDTFPPAAPQGVRAIGAAQSIELTWERSPEPDLAGYRIYRATGAGAFEKLADISQLPTYSDRAVESGKTYRYQVSALDQSGNESPRSPSISATL